MRIAYVIRPIDSKEFLNRCINSIFRQIGKDSIIIVADNRFDDSFELERNINDIVFIPYMSTSYEGKLEAAYSIIPETTDYVVCIDASTVIVPCMNKCIDNENEEADILIPGIAENIGDKYQIKKADEYYMFRNIESLDPWDFVYSRNFFLKYMPGILCKGEELRKLALDQIINGKGISFLSQICMYKNSSINREIGVQQKNQSIWLSYIDKISKIQNTKNRIYVGELVLQIIMSLSDNYDNLKKYANAVKDDAILNKIFEMRIGFQPEKIELLSDEEYENYIEIKKKIEDMYREDSLSDYEIRISNISKKLIEEEERMKKLKEDLNLINNTNVYDYNNGNYIRVVPQLFRDGRLGMKVAIKCIRGWLLYKLHGGAEITN